jgi:DNA-directed RNA polymerase subunit RPC12/RpoP
MNKEKVIELLHKYGNESEMFKAFVTEDEFENLAEDLVKLFAIPVVIDTACPYCGSKRIGKDHVGYWCRKCKREFGQTGL